MLTCHLTSTFTNVQKEQRRVFRRNTTDVYLSADVFYCIICQISSLSFQSIHEFVPLWTCVYIGKYLSVNISILKSWLCVFLFYDDNYNVLFNYRRKVYENWSEAIENRGFIECLKQFTLKGVMCHIAKTREVVKWKSLEKSWWKIVPLENINEAGDDESLFKLAAMHFFTDEDELRWYTKNYRWHNCRHCCKLWTRERW